MISAKEHPKQYCDVLGKRLAFVEMGEGDPIVFVHGNPVSSYLWRNVMPHVEHLGRCIAPDLIGMGDSEKLDDPGPGSYRVRDFYTYFEGLLDALGIERNVILVMHDWGTAPALHWARLHERAVRGLCFNQLLARVMSWDEWDEFDAYMFQQFRGPRGEYLAIERNLFFEICMRITTLRELSEEEIAVYRRPFVRQGEDRRPTLSWPRELPIEGEPADVCEMFEAYRAWLLETEAPKLAIHPDPGTAISQYQRADVKEMKNVTETTMPGTHFVMEDSPDAFGQALADWIATVA